MFATNAKTTGSRHRATAETLEVTEGDLDAVSTSGGRAAPTPGVDQKAKSKGTGGHTSFTCNYFPAGNF